MKGAYKCIKFLTFFITLVLFFVFFSKDTNAVTLSFPIEPTGNSWEQMQVDCDYSQNAGTWVASTLGSDQWNCNNFPSGSNPSLNGIRTHNTIHVEEGKYYQGFLILRYAYDNYAPPAIFWNFNQSSDFDFVTIEELYDDNIYDHIATEQISGTYVPRSEYPQIYNKLYMLTLRAKTTGDVRWQLGNTGNMIKSLNKQYVFGLRKIVEYKPSSIESALEEQNRKDDEDRDNMESQQSDSQDGADDSQEEAESTGTTLLGAFTSFVNAITNASPSNCRLNMDIGRFDAGNVDLCSLDPPAGFSAIASIFLILFCVPLSIATARKVINLFRSFQ